MARRIRCKLTKTLKEFNRLDLHEKNKDLMQECNTPLNCYNIEAGNEYCSAHKLRGYELEQRIHEGKKERYRKLASANYNARKKQEKLELTKVKV